MKLLITISDTLQFYYIKAICFFITNSEEIGEQYLNKLYERQRLKEILENWKPIFYIFKRLFLWLFFFFFIFPDRDGYIESIFAGGLYLLILLFQYLIKRNKHVAKNIGIGLIFVIGFVMTENTLQLQEFR